MAVDSDHLRRVVEAHQGNLSSCARELGVTRQALTRRLNIPIVLQTVQGPEDVTILAYAERLRGAAGIKGPRSRHSDVADRDERARLLDAIAQAGGYRPAATMLGISPSTIVRRIRKHGITPAEVDTRRSEMPEPTE